MNRTQDLRKITKMGNKDGVASTSQGDEDTMAFGITDVVQNRNYDSNDLLQQIWNSGISKEYKSANNSYPEDYGRCEITVDHFMKHIMENDEIIIEKLDIGTKTKLKNIIFDLYNVDFPNLTGKQRLLVEMILSLLQSATPGKELTNMTKILTSNDNCVAKTKDLHN